MITNFKKVLKKSPVMDKLVSVAMATYNGEKFLKEQLDSILSQTYRNIEVIICDDCSTDNTVNIIEKYRKKDKRIKLFQNKEKLGIIKNFAKAISLCSGVYIALSDQDDIWLENKIEILVNNIETCDLIHSDVILIDDSGNIISKKWEKYNIYENSFEKFVFGNTVTGCTVLFNSNLKKQFFPIPSGEKYHDWWLALLASKRRGVKYINNKLTLYRQYTSQSIGANLETRYQKLHRYIKQIINRKNSKRYKFALFQIKRLQSFLVERNDLFSKEEKKVISDALSYYTDYISNFIHIKSFLIAKKYADKIYSKDRYLRLLIRDIVG